MRGSIRTATIVALFCLGALSVTAAPVFAADDEDDGPTVNIPGQSSDDEDSSSPSSDSDEDDNNAPEPYDGASVDDDKDQADDDDSGPIEGHDFDSSATDLLDGTGDSGD